MRPEAMWAYLMVGGLLCWVIIIVTVVWLT